MPEENQSEFLPWIMVLISGVAILVMPDFLLSPEEVDSEWWSTPLECFACILCLLGAGVLFFGDSSFEEVKSRKMTHYGGEPSASSVDDPEGEVDEWRHSWGQRDEEEARRPPCHYSNNRYFRYCNKVSVAQCYGSSCKRYVCGNSGCSTRYGWRYLCNSCNDAMHGGA